MSDMNQSGIDKFKENLKALKDAFIKSFLRSSESTGCCPNMSSTDPDAAIVNRGKPKLSYQVHRAVDERSEIITATEATAGDINEAHLMVPLLAQHKTITGLTADTVVADSK